MTVIPSLLVTLAAQAVLLLALVWSVAVPDRRIWPLPSGGPGWRLALVWVCSGLTFTGLLVVGVADVGSLGLNGQIWRWIGAVVVLAGIALAFNGVTAVGQRATAGLRRRLVTDGPYRYSRNPQYLGDLLVLLGVVVLTGSSAAVMAALPAAVCFALFPFSEEPWLAEQYAEAYRDYRRRVPRFIGWPERDR